ncbi:MAG: hypothetical protein MH208_06630 [Marinobacter sp.]|nr:hypothetical protein [Marinobacter sp.]
MNERITSQLLSVRINDKHFDQAVRMFDSPEHGLLVPGAELNRWGANAAAKHFDRAARR